MKKISFVWLCVLMAILFFQCEEKKVEENRYSIIPSPVDMVKKTGQFTIDGNSTIIFDQENEHIKLVGQYLQGLLAQASPYNLPVVNGGNGRDNAILLTLDTSISADEGYALMVTEKQISIKAKKPIGLFYGVQTLRQLLPVEIESETQVTNISWSVPAVEIEDTPRFKYRGMHLDVGRHFYPVDFIKRYIDLIAMHKMNTFHWHLTEDQGWRIEIEKYPKLTEAGAWRDETLLGSYSDLPHQFDGERYGGFYTKDQVREVVAYAKERFVTVIPEIELPGHSLAALAAYPELSCTGGPFKVATLWGVFDDIYCAGNEQTFEFFEDVLTEVMELFPSEYIHIGGDEAPKTQWEQCSKCQRRIKEEGLKDEHELQNYFITRIENFLNDNGRRMIGWDEILEGGLAPNATVMSWRGMEGGIAAAQQHHDVVMTPVSHCYFDYYQSEDRENEPLAIGGFTSFEKVYSFEPVPESLSELEAKYILGGQGNVWTEYMKTTDQVEYMILPRMTALAEVLWSPKEARDWRDFSERMQTQFARFDHKGHNYARHFLNLSGSVRDTGEGHLQVSLSIVNPENYDIRYALDGTEPTISSQLYNEPVALSLSDNITFKAVAFNKETMENGRTFFIDYQKNLATRKQLDLTVPASEKYRGSNGAATLVDGFRGNQTTWDDWLGFNGDDLEATIDLEHPQTVSSVKIGILVEEGSWIYPPESVEVLGSIDGNEFFSLGSLSEAGIHAIDNLIEIPIKNGEVKRIKVIAKNLGIIPQNMPGAGQQAWLFVDEIMVE